MNEPMGNDDKGVFFGWWIVAVSMIGISMGMGSVVGGTLGVFMLPFEEEFGWNRAEVGFAHTMLSISTALALPIAGRIVDHIGSRPMILASMFAFALLLASIPTFVTQLWQLMLVMVLIGSLAVCTTSLPYMRALSAWFVCRRGIALGIAASGIGLGYTYSPLIAQFMIDNFNWRMGYYALSALVLLIGIPLVVLIFRDSPVDKRMRPDGADMTESLPKAASRDVGLTVTEVLRRREFWILASAGALVTFVLYGIHGHIVPMLIDRGMSPSGAVAVASTIGFSVFISRVGGGYLLDHFFAPYIAAVTFCLSALGTGMLALGAVDGMAFIAAVTVGLAIGAEVDVVAYLTGRYFGLRSFGTVYGLFWTAMLTGLALGPFIYGIGYETSGSYIEMLYISVGIIIVAVILILQLGAYPDWEQAAPGER